jgi:hypothetical protein
MSVIQSFQAGFKIPLHMKFAIITSQPADYLIQKKARVLKKLLIHRDEAPAFL